MRPRQNAAPPPKKNKQKNWKKNIRTWVVGCMEREEERRAKVSVNNGQLHLRIRPQVAHANHLDQMIAIGVYLNLLEHRKSMFILNI